MEIFESLLNKRIEIYKIYKSGLGISYKTLRFTLPILFLILFLIIIYSLKLSKENTLDLIKQMNSLIGIILGFSIASFSIFVSINNEKLEKKSNNTIYTFRQIGSSLFFFNVERSLFIAVIGILLLYIELGSINEYFQLLINGDDLLSLFSKDFFKLYFFCIYIFAFFQLLFNLFYSSIFLNSSIKK
ncbi:hypothetical protein [Aliarcobacter butzleri]|uniref:hypothetical protein n=1 Tax=Aliarcobacter butzleri TaxID=28197 RepID=UPI0021B16BE5|nr:hypothetical protein [Aliarcobacter butzleri]MCT7625793.1 hypothetical protein [Aliarcobacter butzleri]